MTAVNGKTFLVLLMLVALAFSQNFQHYGAAEVPDVLSYNSPLRRPDSLKSRPYFDFLSTLYAHDADKSQLFTPYARQRRAVSPSTSNHEQQRSKRAIVFRPLFVYRQQQVRKQNQKRRRV